MKNFLTIIQGWFNDPTFQKILEMFFVIVVVAIVFRVLAGILPRQVADSDLRYRIRKGINLFGYVVMILIVTSIFSDSLGQLTVIFGAVGAGIAFALQEVIVSFAGWVAISFGWRSLLLMRSMQL